MQTNYLLILLLAVFFSSCRAIPESGPFETAKIMTGFGPEDIVLDTISTGASPRLLLSCDTRRESDSLTTGIYWIDLTTDSVFEFLRLNEPADLIFHPHGFDFVLIDSIPRLFVISHDDKNKKHPVIRYKVLNDVLVFEEIYKDSLFISPNDIFALSDGTFFLTNDAAKRNSFIEQALSLKRSSVVYYPQNRKPYYIDHKLSYANGIYFDDPYLFVSTVRQNTIFKFKIENGQALEKENLCNIVGGDNITKYKDKYLVAAHLNSIAFLRHRKNSAIPSPSVIYQFDPNTGKKEVLFSDNGELISAASTAIRYGDYLYVSQVFDNFVLKVKVD